MMKSQTANPLNLKASIKAGPTTTNPNTLAIKTGVEAGGININRNAIAVKTGVRAGGFRWNHNVSPPMKPSSRRLVSYTTGP